MKKGKTNNWVFTILMCISILGIAVSSFYIIRWKLNVDQNRSIKDHIEDSIEIEDDKLKVNFEELKKQNPDTVAYLTVDGTDIQYVVVKCSNNDYYLTHNFHEKYNVAGWIFADYKNKVDGTDQNLVIYGHNMKDGSMFGTIENIFRSDWQNKYKDAQITLVTENGEAKYQIFSIYRINPEDYYIQTAFSGNEYGDFLQTVKGRSEFDFGVDVTSDDQIITLSTCLYGGAKRIALHAKKI